MLKNTFKLFFCLALLPTISNQAHAQEDTATAKVLFWVEDALGNRDSVWYIEINAETTTNGIDEHLGEINLYGVPPTKVLDLRIIQRTDTNYLWQVSDIDYVPIWLYNESEIGSSSFTIYSCEQNIDLKTDYRHPWYFYQRQKVVLKIHADNYPVKLYPVYQKYYDRIVASFYGQDGKFKDYTSTYYLLSYPDTTREICRFDSEDENYLIYMWLSYGWNIKDSISEITIFPNPNDDYIIIEGLENEVVQLYDAVGSFIYSFTISASPYNLNISDLPVGAYYLKNNDNQLLGKFIKEGN